MGGVASRACRILVIITSLVLTSSCTSLMQKMPDMTPAEFAELSDKNMCDHMLWPQSEEIQNFQNELSRRGLNRNQCCYRRIQRAPLYCYGYITPKGKGLDINAPSDRVELIYEEDGTTREFKEIGQLVDTWQNSRESQVTTGPASQVFDEKLLKLFTGEKGQVKLNRKFVENRFQTQYQERAREIGADALVLVIAEEGPYSSRMSTGSFVGPQGQVYTSGVETSGISTKLVFRVVKFVE